MPRNTTAPTPTSALTRVTYNVEECAAVLGLSSRTVYRLVWSGELRALRSGRRVLIQPGALEDYLGALDQVATR
jgi:excisionase family DNA binding protein